MNKEFAMQDVFHKVELKRLKKTFNKKNDLSKELTPEFNLPLVNAKNGDNGIMYYGRSEDWESDTYCIDIVNDGAVSTGNVYAQPQRTGVLYNAYLIKPNKKIESESVLLYLAKSIEKSIKTKFGYDNKATWTKVKSMPLSLPVIEHSDPNHEYTVDDIDWQYMEDRIKELEEDRIKELEAYLKATNLDDYELTDEDKKVLSLSRKSASNKNSSLETDCEDGALRFKEFNIGASYTMRGKTIDVDKDGLFNIVPTKIKINAINIEFNGKHPYVARGEGENGIRGYIDYDEQYLNEANTISFGQDTATVNYQSHRYFTGDKIQVFKLNKKYGNLTEDKAIYLINSIKKVFERFLWGQQSYALDIISKIKITLPVALDGKPDFDYMERYIKAIKKLTIANVVKYKDNVIDTTKMLVNSQS